MSLNFRIFIGYLLIVVIASVLFLNVFMSELKPGMRQSSEDSLVDTSNILAELVAAEFVNNPDQLPNFTSAVERFLHRSYQAEIFSINKKSSAIRVYITDEKGIVRFDSSSRDIGADYSQWNDVHLTLRGKYGARSTKSDPDDELSTVMHVAAPIISENKIVGVLTVAKPNFSVQPFIDMAYKKIIERGLLLVIFSLVIALTIAFLLTRSIRKLVQYADNISHGKKVTIPNVHEKELANLASSIDNMRIELAGKDYVEKYVHALTHELKSPVSAIKGASEILNPLMSEEDQNKFIGNIQFEAHRIDDMINRLLSLVTVEKQEALNKVEKLDLIVVIEQIIKTKESQLLKLGIMIEQNTPHELFVHGDAFLLFQALDNLLQNAIDFSVPNSSINISTVISEQIIITIEDQGSGIPDYALHKIFDRFYSLVRPHSRQKSSGLGLCFVKQIAELHDGSIQLENNKDIGAKATVSLPVSK
jgi:two-component system sensor histidine kinase CreC